MQITKLQQLLEQQQKHDTTYHLDICYQSNAYKLKHFTLHFSKYFARIIQAKNDYSKITPLMIDTMLITLSLSNTFIYAPEEFNVKGKDRGLATTILYANIVETLAKASDSLDHAEEYNSTSAVKNCILVLFMLIEQYIYNLDIKDFETQLLLRYQSIRDKRLR